MPTPSQNSLSGEFILSQEKKDDTKNDQTFLKQSPSTNHLHTHSKPKFFSSLCHYPEGVTFQNQEADEEIILLIRRDFITNVPWILSVLFFALLLPGLFIAVPLLFPNIVVNQILILISVSFYYTVLMAFTLIYFTIWYFNVGLVTNKRIIDLDVANILVKETSEARLSSIADVTYTQVGGIRGIFDYGDVRVLTETYEQNIEFDRAPNPNMIRKIIGELLADKLVT